MRLFERLAVKVPRKVALAAMSFAGLWGMRTPPEPKPLRKWLPPVERKWKRRPIRPASHLNGL